MLKQNLLQLMSKLAILLISLFLVLPKVLFAETPATEVRAVWLTLNYGLDWPRNSEGAEEQKKELIDILDRLQKYNFNRVMFQVRARGEVFYHSDIEPISPMIFSGNRDSDSFDPLLFVVEECHERGLECHAWMVTYPLGSDKHVQSLGPNSVTKTTPSITKKFKGEWFLDPANPETDDYLISIVEEIVTGYDVDGIHFDYIRYPDNRGEFPDERLYRLLGSGKSREEWRRDNITRFVTKVYDRVKSVKPWVQISSATLGRYRALNDKGIGWTAFETVYQDAGRWVKLGKHDALYPMMYYKDELFYPYLDDWMKNSYERCLVVGLGVYQMIELGWSSRDILDQIDYSRLKRADGQAFFRTENLLSNNKGIIDQLESYYRYPAKLPAMKWLSDTIPEKPYDLCAEKLPDGMFELKWSQTDSDARVTYNVYRSETDDFCRDRAENILATGLWKPQFYYTPPEGDIAYYYYVTISDSFNSESEISTPAFFYHSDMIK